MLNLQSVVPEFARSTRQLVIGAGVSLTFAALGKLVRGVTRSGAAAGAAVCFVLYIGAGFGAVAALLSVFVVTWCATRWKYQKKQHLGTAERREGRRASQVFANLGVAAASGFLCTLGAKRFMFIMASTAALAEAAADTVSSEVGQASSASARLITNWKLVPAGTDGGVTLAGTLAGILAALGVSAVGAGCGLLPWSKLAIPLFAAVAGTAADSFMGAWLEQRRWLNNDAVNFLGTLVAAGIAFALCFHN